MGIVSSIFSGIFGSNAANKTATVEANASTHAADLQKQAADEALAFNKQQYGNSLNLLAPYYNTGVAANGRLGFLMGLNPGQGLPQGVVNPNAPQPSSPSVDASSFDPGSLNALRALRAGGGGRVAMPQNAAMLQPGQNPFSNPTLPGVGGTASTFSMNAPITSGGTTGQTGSILQGLLPGEGGTPGGAAALNGGTGADTNPFPNGLGNVGGTTANTNQGGTGQVAQTGGFNMRPPITSPMFNPNDPNQGVAPDGSAPSGGAFGSLAQGWGKTFQSPTNVTEQNDPGYQFRLAQGNQALQNSAAARGGLLSGGTAKALNDYAQGSASQEYGNVYNRALQNYNTNYNTFTNDQTNLFNRLQALAGGGQTSANQLSSAGVNAANTNANIGLTSANNIGNSLQNAANATGSGYINQANAINGAIKSGTGSLADLLAMFGGG